MLAVNKNGWKLIEYIDIAEDEINQYQNVTGAYCILKIKDKLNRILANNTSQPLEKIQKDVDRDYYMSAQEALEYGIIDRILEKHE